MVLTTPLIQRVAETGPVHVVATPANAPILTHHPAVASVIVFDKRGVDKGWRGIQRVATRLRAMGADTAYLAQGSGRTAMLAFLAGIPRRVGFASSAGRWLYTHRMPYERSWHHAERLWSLASHAEQPELRRPFGVRPSLYPGAEDHRTVDALFAEFHVEPHQQLVALAPGSVWPTKRWPGYAALAARLVERAANERMRFVVIGGADDRTLAVHIADAVSAKAGNSDSGRFHSVIDATGRLSLLASAALLSRVSMVVTNDSAPLHLASAMNTPTVALFGPTVPSMGFGPLADIHHVPGIETLSCRPCGPHGAQQCPMGHWRCMRDLSVDTVADAVTAIMRRTVIAN